jgi:hypothetical protein
MSIYIVHPFKRCVTSSNLRKRKSLTTRDYNQPEENPTYYDLWLNFLWRQKCLENPDLFELDCAHGKDCQVKNDCHCTTFEECSANDMKRDEELKVSRKTLHRNVRRRKGYQQPQPQSQEQDPLLPQQKQKGGKEHAYDNFEYFAGEYFGSCAKEDLE